MPGSRELLLSPPKLAPCCTPIKHSFVLLSSASFNLSVMKLNALSWPSCMMRKLQDKYRKTWSQTASRSPTWMPFSLLRDQCQRGNMLPIRNTVLRKAVLGRNPKGCTGGCRSPLLPSPALWALSDLSAAALGTAVFTHAASGGFAELPPASVSSDTNV